MQMRPQIQINSMIKAMTDVVIPAIDSSNQLALEQSKLVVGMLDLMAQQLPFQFRFDRDELKRLATVAQKLEAIADADPKFGGPRRQLQASRISASALLDQCAVDPAQLEGSIRELREMIGAVVTAIGSGDNAKQIAQGEACILDMTREQTLRDRALLVAQGWELDPGALPPIDELLKEAE